VETFIRQKSVKTFGRKAFVFTEYAANFYILNVQKGQVNKIHHNISKRKSIAIWTSLLNHDCWLFCE
jgi:hypothetical protein